MNFCVPAKTAKSGGSLCSSALHVWGKAVCIDNTCKIFSVSMVANEQDVLITHFYACRVSRIVIGGLPDILLDYILRGSVTRNRQDYGTDWRLTELFPELLFPPTPCNLLFTVQLRTVPGYPGRLFFYLCSYQSNFVVGQLSSWWGGGTSYSTVAVFKNWTVPTTALISGCGNQWGCG